MAEGMKFWRCPKCLRLLLGHWPHDCIEDEEGTE